MTRFVKTMKSGRGQSTVEFALALPILALAFFSAVEFSHLFYVRLNLQHALREAGRYMVTGQTKKNQDGDSLARAEAIQGVFCKNLIGTGLSCTDLDAFNLKPSDGGGPGQPVTVTATFTKPFFTSIFRLFNPLFPKGISLRVSTTWKNEPFPTV